MPLIAWLGLALGFVLTFAEARRLYRRYGLLVAGAIWPLLSAIVASWVFCATVNHYNFGSPRLPIYFHAWHLLMIIVGPVAVAALFGRKYNLSAGIFAGGVVLACTFFFWVSMLFGYGTSAAAQG